MTDVAKTAVARQDKASRDKFPKKAHHNSGRQYLQLRAKAILVIYIITKSLSGHTGDMCDTHMNESNNYAHSLSSTLQHLHAKLASANLNIAQGSSIKTCQIVLHIVLSVVLMVQFVPRLFAHLLRAAHGRP